MKYILTLLIPFALLLIGCGDSSSSLSSSATTTSASTPTVLPSGLVLAVNPKITFTANLSDAGTITVTYENSDSLGGYPVHSGNVDVTMAVSGSQILLTFDFSRYLSIAPSLSMVLDGFLDRGGDGYTDEFTVISTVDSVLLPSATGQFVGSEKPENQNISASQRVDTSGIPTEEEFQKYLVGFAIKATNLTDQKDLIFVYFQDSTNVYQVSDYGYATGTYVYNYNQGSPTLSVVSIESDGDRYTSTLNLDFSGGWYKGSWQETEHSVNGVPDAGLDNGTFEVYSGTSIKDLENFLRLP